MAVVANLDVLLSANTRKFDAGMKRSQKLLSGFSSGTIAFGVAMGAGAVATSALRKEFEEMDVVGKLADRIGETTEEISRLQHAARITGATADQLNAGLDVMTKRLGEAAMGSGEAGSALDELGLDVHSLIALKPAAAFKLISERISELDSQAAKAAVTSKIFSRANQELVNTLDLGADGLKKMADESDRLGNTLSAEAAASAAEASDAMTRLDEATKATKRSFATFAAPELTEFVTQLTEASVNVNRLIDSIGGLGEAIGKIDHFIPTAFLKLFNKVVGDVSEGPAPLNTDRIPVGGLENIIRFLNKPLGFDLPERGFATFGSQRFLAQAPLPPQPEARGAPLFGGQITRLGETGKRQEDLLKRQVDATEGLRSDIRRRPQLEPAAL